MKLSTPAVLFDFDGVLVDSTPAVIRNWDAFAARHGYGPGDAILHEHGRRAREKIQAFRDEHRLDFSVDDETEWFNQLEIAKAAELIVFPGATQLLEAIPRGRWAIYTACTRHLVLARLQAAGLPIPEVVISADDVVRGKPDPEGYITAARQLGVEPRSCVIVEDAPAGITAGHQTGAKVIAVATTHAPAELAHADIVVPELAALRYPWRRPLSPSRRLMGGHEPVGFGVRQGIGCERE